MLDIQNIKKNHTISDQRPFLGLRPFEEKNKSQFGGRDKEIRELFGLIENRGLTVVFGKSGIGKTSLLKAGLMPELRQNFYFPMYLRIDFSCATTPLQQLRKFIFEEMKKKDPTILPIGGVTLWEYFHHIKLVDGLVTPILILDQFEEMFTLGDKNFRDVLEFLIELADLAENRIPLTVQEEYQNRNETVSSRYGEQPYRVVLSLREDYLARLEELKRYIPSIMNNRFRVVQMTIGQAMDAAIKPGKGLIDQAVAKEIILKLPEVSQSDFEFLEQNGSNRQKLKVEPFLLSLICDRINEKRIEAALDTITIELVSQFNVTDVISSFYNETIRKYGEIVEQAIEDRLLTEGGFRKLQALEELQGTYDISDQIIDELVDARVLRKEIRDGVDYTELIHDVLAPVIKEKRNKRVEVERNERIREEVERNKAKTRSKIIKIGTGIATGIAVILGVVIAIAISNYKQKTYILDRNKKMELARDLIIQAQSLSSYDDDNQKAALLSRTAYLIFNTYKSKEAGEDMYSENFYNSMYTALKNLSVPLEVYTFDDTRITMRSMADKSIKMRSMAYVKHNESYIVGLRNATVNKITKDTVYTMYRFADSTTRVTSMALFESPNKNLLAMSGTFDSIVVYDLDLNKTLNKIQIPDSKKIGKSVVFTEDGRLILGQDESIMMWDIDNGEPIKWHKRNQKIWHDSTKTSKILETDIKWEDPILQIPGKSLNCFSVFKDSTIAIGIDGGIILLTNDEYKELVFSKIGKITAIGFNSSGENLLMGNEKGEVFTMSLSDYSIESHQSHTAKITDIAYSPNDSLVATASRDGSVVIWNTKWGDLPLNTRVLNGTLGPVYNISFTSDGDYLVAGYDDGTILKWPTDLNMMAELICERVSNNNLSEEDWKKYIKLNELNRDDYTCNKN